MLRVLLGVVLLIDIVNLYRHLPLFPRAHPLLGLVLLAWMGIIVAMISGYRMAVIANLLCCGIILGGIAPNGGFQQSAADSVMIGTSLLAVVLPQVSEGAARWIIAAYLSSIYVDSAIHKLLSPMWLRGLGLSTSAALPSLVWIGTAWMKYIPATLLRCVGWGVIAFELLFPVLYWRRSTRLPALAAGIAMHVGIAVLYPIPAFSGSMIVLYLALLLEERDGISPAFPARGRVRYALLGIWAMCIGNVYFASMTSQASIMGVAFRAARKIAWMSAGIASHSVFDHSAFIRYSYQVRLFGGGEVSIPYGRDNLFPVSISDRVWEVWWKRTSAATVAMADAGENLRAWARFYAPGVNPIEIQARRQEVRLDVVDTNVFGRNQSQLWRTVGTIDRNRLAWTRPPEAGEDVGTYMMRILRQ
ncbi:MAG TPA: hypothetical protein VMJ75_06940 [Candidatus Acidoferrales bacterium]|nr:hypothetical protein [Candidatus Acidoferrales bacterium]